MEDVAGAEEEGIDWFIWRLENGRSDWCRGGRY